MKSVDATPIGSTFRRWYAVEIDAGLHGLPSKIEVGKRLRALGYTMPDPRTTSGMAFICGIDLTGEAGS